MWIGVRVKSLVWGDVTPPFFIILGLKSPFSILLYIPPSLSLSVSVFT